ncbi:MAG: hypothetical protein ACOC2C_03545 [Cyclonatronaceae bacterium]
MMRNAPARWGAAALTYGLILSFIPLLRELHFLSAGLTALLGAFAAALYASTRVKMRATPASGLRALTAGLLISLLPAFPLLIAGWLRGCLSFEGLSFWLLLPPPSVMLGFAIGRYFRLFSARPRLYSLLLLLLISLGSLLFELLAYPQVYFHNHVWGYWPGPIYDEQVALSPSVLYFRLISLSWAGLFWLLPSVRLRKVKGPAAGAQRSIRSFAGLLLLSLLLSYSNLSQNGIISPPQYLQQELGQRSETEFAILYHDASLSREELKWIAATHDFHIREIAARLELDPQKLPRIQSYIYRHSWQKKRLTGAGNTVYVPVWQRKPQLHIQQAALSNVLRHELVHVIAREFGMPVLNASPNIALVEGLAVALQGARTTQASLHQIVAAQPELPAAEKMQRLMSPAGFYALSGSLSYTLAGSFVDWLLREYSVEQFKTAYRTGRLSAGYETDFEALIAGWHAFLKQVPVDEAQLALSNQVFSAPGIAEKSCVFHISPEQRVMEGARELQVENADSLAYSRLNTYARQHPERLSTAFLRLWGTAALRHSAEAAAGFADAPAVRAATAPQIRLLRADAYFISQNERAGLALLQNFETNDDGSLPEAIALRLNPDIRPRLLYFRYGSPAVPLAEMASSPRSLHELPPSLRPYALRQCLRPDAPEAPGCVFEPPETEPYEYRTAAEYQLMEAYTRRLFARGFGQEAARWLEYLQSGLRQSSAAALHLARLERLDMLGRQWENSSG